MNVLEAELPYLAMLSDRVTPRWVREIDLYLRVKSQFVLVGNVRDRFAFRRGGDSYDLLTAPEFIVDYLHLRGYRYFISIDPLGRLNVRIPTDIEDEAAYRREVLAWCVEVAKTVNLDADDIQIPAEDAAGSLIQRPARVVFANAMKLVDGIVRQAPDSPQCKRAAVLCEYLMGQREQGQTTEIEAFIQALVSSYEAAVYPEGFNPVFWICDRENELPPWLTVDNPRIHTLSLAKPDLLVRERVCRQILSGRADFREMSASDQARCVADFAGQTDGLTMNDLVAIGTFASDRAIPSQDIAAATRRYKVGITEDPWATVTPAKLGDVQTIIERRVKGQPRAVTKTMDILKRSVLGLSGAHLSRSSNKPKGTLFFAGPTGVGKTELAKSLAEGLFGDEQAYIRFDMSEFGKAESDQRLMGAPPGYVGYEAGGELVRAVKEKPFSVILFDEIEKSHPSIFDKFLQILDDGQLTSGKGERVYFSEAVIIFTSNLGASGQLPPEISYETLEKQIREKVKEHFVEKLGRPELLNRLGENIVVFDLIRRGAAEEIVDKMLNNLVEASRERLDMAFEVSAAAREQLIEYVCADGLAMGGRGIGNKIEEVLINPLGRQLMAMDPRPRSLRIDNIKADTLAPDLQISAGE